MSTAKISIPSAVLLRPISSLRKWLIGGGGGGGCMLVRMAAALLTTLLASTAALILHHRHPMLINSLLWPNSNVRVNPKDPDVHVNIPLPPGSLGCPWLGSNNLGGSQRWGPEYFYRQASSRLGNPRVWKSYFLGSPYVVVSGKDWVQRVNNMEFSRTTSMAEPRLTTTASEGDQEHGRKDTARSTLPKKNAKARVFGQNNLMFESNKDKHTFLRKLVGSAMTPQALKQALPTIQQTALDVIEREVVQPMLLDNTTTANNRLIRMEDVCVDYTLDIVQRQFLGLNLPSHEVDAFRDKLKIWTKAFFSIVGQISISWLVTRSAPYQAKLYIESKLEDKIDSLLRNGPDNASIVSNMLFAVDTDKDDNNIGSSTNKNKLSRDEVVENALLLVLAGAETSAGTLTLAMLLLGLHPDKYSQLVNEQRKTVQEHGEELTQAILDKECPYLDAVIKEALRMGPITGGFPRRALETIVIDGVQIPKNWLIFSTIRLTHQLDPVSRLPEDAHMDVYEGFQPERWLQSETIPSDFIPFGAGPRYCIGASLATIEMKVFLAMLARRVGSFELTNYGGTGTTKKPVSWNPSTLMPRPMEGVAIQSIDGVQQSW